MLPGDGVLVLSMLGAFGGLLQPLLLPALRREEPAPILGIGRQTADESCSARKTKQLLRMGIKKKLVVLR